MINFDVDARDGANGSACNTCCCKNITIKPGETNKININYAPWSVPIGGRGLSDNTQFVFDKIHSVELSNSGNIAPVFSSDGFDVVVGSENTAIVYSVNAGVVDTTLPADVILYKIIGGGEHGNMHITTAGVLTYTPFPGYSGYDRVFVSVSDGVNKPVVAEIAIVIQPTLPTLPLPINMVKSDPVLVSSFRKSINVSWHQMTFPLTANFNAIPGEIYRLTVRQQALDCDCNSYWHMSCYDITVGSC